MNFVAVPPGFSRAALRASLAAIIGLSFGPIALVPSGPLGLNALVPAAAASPAFNMLLLPLPIGVVAPPYCISGMNALACALVTNIPPRLLAILDKAAPIYPFSSIVLALAVAPAPAPPNLPPLPVVSLALLVSLIVFNCLVAPNIFLVLILSIRALMSTLSLGLTPS